MKKFLSLFAAILFAAGMMAEPVVLPDTLDVSNVSFRSEGMPNYVITEGDTAGTYFDMGAHDSSNDTLLYAEWDVTIQPLKYNLAVDVYNTNSWSVQLHLLNLDGDTVKSLRYKGHSGEKGQFAIGSLDLTDLAAGNYKLRARAATAWSAMKLKDVIVEADYKGASVALPGTLLPAYALLSSGASVANGAIAFAPGTAPDEYATWNVSFAAAGSYNVSIDMTASNGHTYGVALLSENGETSIGSVAEAQSWDTGVKELGAIEVPAAGDYKVKLTNATQWSEAVLNSITFAAPEPVEPLMKTIYCKMDKAWWKADGAAVGIYAWDGDVKNANWPGERMTPVEGEDDLWSIELDINAYKNCIFTRVNGSGDIADWGAKSGNLTIPTDDNDLYTITSEAAVWGDPGVAGEWSKYEPSAPVVDEWAEIKFAEAAAADDIAEDAAYTVPGTEFALTLHDAGNKMVIDGNDCRFGTAEAYTMYNFRIKSGGASGSDKNYFTLNIPEAGTLRIAPRTGSNSATDRALIVIQGGDTLYNQIVQESQAVDVLEGENTVKVYPYVDVTVAAGEVVVRYTAGMNFYAFAFKADAGETPEETKYYAKNNWGGADWAWKEMSKVVNEEGTFFVLDNVVFGGSGVNINTVAADEGAKWITTDSMMVVDAQEQPSTIAALDTVKIVYNPLDANHLGVMILGKYVEPAPEFVIKVWKAEATTDTTHATKYIDNEYLEVKTAYQGKVVAQNAVIFDEVFTHAIQVRADAYPSDQDPVGAVRAECTPLVITAKKDATIAIYYMRQAIEKAWADNDNKDIILYDQAAPATKIAATKIEADSVLADSTYYFMAKAYTLEAGHTYTLTAKGTTIKLFGIGYPAIPEVEHTYTVAGNSAAVFGTTWDPTNTENDMEKVEAGIYLFSVEDVALAKGEIAFKVCEDHAWTNAWPAQDYKLNIDSAGIYTIAIYFDAVTKEINAQAKKTADAVVMPKIILHGNFSGNWVDSEEFTIAEDNLTATLALTLTAGTYEFGMKFDGTWKANAAQLTRENASTSLLEGNGNMKITADVDGEYVFTYTFLGEQLVVTYPAKPEGIDNTAVEAKAVKSLENGILVIRKNGKAYTITGLEIR